MFGEWTRNAFPQHRRVGVMNLSYAVKAREYTEYTVVEKATMALSQPQLSDSTTPVLTAFPYLIKERVHFKSALRNEI